MRKKGGLGRGFDSLIPTDVLDEAFDPTATQDEKISQLKELPISQVQPDPDQPRKHFDDTSLEEMAQSIKAHGIIQPLIATQRGDNYVIVAGERRYRAAKLAGLRTLPVLVRTVSDQHKLELALIENLQRKDLNILEVATAYLKLNTQFNLTHEQIGRQAGGKASSTIANVIRLLRLPAFAKEALASGRISEGHARQILALHDEEVQRQLLDLILREDWTVRKAEQFVIGHKEGREGEAMARAKAKTRTETPLTQAIGASLKTLVTLKSTAKGGQLIIRYTDDADLERISQQLLG